MLPVMNFKSHNELFNRLIQLRLIAEKSLNDVQKLVNNPTVGAFKHIDRHNEEGFEPVILI